MTPSAAHRLRVIRARAQARVGFARLATAAVRGRVGQVWVGDSHSVLLNTSRFPFPSLAMAGEGRWVWHLGPRLMFSVARDGFPPAMRRSARALSRLRGTCGTSWYFVFGEIDVRCHLVPRLRDSDDLSFVDAYVERVGVFARMAGAREAVLVVPPPPSPDVLDHVAFPVVGTAAERVAAHRAVRDRLVHAARDQRAFALRVLDLTDVLADETGLMRAEFTDDGCHTNEAGREAVRRTVAR